MSRSGFYALLSLVALWGVADETAANPAAVSPTMAVATTNPCVKPVIPAPKSDNKVVGAFKAAADNYTACINAFMDQQHAIIVARDGDAPAAREAKSAAQADYLAWLTAVNESWLVKPATPATPAK